MTVIALFNYSLLNIYKDIVFSENIVILLVTLIAGLFGFIIAVIPFAIQLFNQDNTNKKNEFLNKLMKKEKFDFFVKPMFNRFVKMLKLMFYLFTYTFFINLIQTIDSENINFLHNEILKVPIKTYLLLIVFYIYTLLIIEFFIMLKNIIRDLETLVFNFFRTKSDRNDGIIND
jgi:hypothetical protein